MILLYSQYVLSKTFLMCIQNSNILSSLVIKGIIFRDKTFYNNLWLLPLTLLQYNVWSDSLRFSRGGNVLRTYKLVFIPLSFYCGGRITLFLVWWLKFGKTAIFTKSLGLRRFIWAPIYLTIFQTPTIWSKVCLQRLFITIFLTKGF